MARPNRLFEKPFAFCTVLRTRIVRLHGQPSRRRCLCQCVCSKKFFTWSHHLRSENTSSCGCKKATRLNKQTVRYTEGFSVKGHPMQLMYARWSGMIDRCTRTTHHAYHRYGGRGIRVCERWHNFETFLTDMGLPPFKGASIDRIDNSGNYEPSNCRWATAKMQSQNRG
jgi:hypothetical protein